MFDACFCRFFICMRSEVFYKLLGYLRNFYTASFLVWFVWIGFLDNNNLKSVWLNYWKRVELEHEQTYYRNKIHEVKRERNEVFGNRKLIEKWAREKYLMRKPGEDIYVIVDENDKPIEDAAKY